MILEQKNSVENEQSSTFPWGPITLLSFQEMEKLASNLPQKATYGECSSEHEYLVSLKLMHLASNNSVENRTHFISQLLKNDLVAFNSLIDVGCGNTDLILPFMDHFNHVILLDKQEEMLEIAYQKTRFKKSLVHCILTDARDYQYPDSPPISFIVFSHILYYIPQNEWIDVIGSAYSALEKGGKIVVMLSGGSEKQILIQNFGGKNINLSRLVYMLSSIYKNKIQYHYRDEFFTAPSLRAILPIADILLQDAKGVTDRETLSKFLKKYHAAPNGIFKIHSNELFITITK